MMSLEAHGRSEQGSARQTNADQFLIAELAKSLTVLLTSLDEEALEPVVGLHGYVLAVADGVSSLPDSDRASSLATEILAGYLLYTVPWLLSLRPDDPSDFEDDLRRALGTSDQVLKARMENSGTGPMATTLTVAYAVWNRLYVAHAGDSRCYLARDGELEQLTRDQTMAQAFLDQGGSLSPEEARESPLSNVLTSAIGGEDADLSVQVTRHELAPGDLILLGTDGLHGAISDDQIREILLETDSIAETTNGLVRAAHAADDRDDVTVVLARIEE